MTGQRPTDDLGITEGHYKGAACEYLAAAYYLSLGAQVYWPSVQHDSSDFIVQVAGRFYRVQVKAASPGRRGSLFARTGGTATTRPEQLYDVLFVVSPDRYWEIPAAALDAQKGVGVSAERWSPYIVYRER